MTFYLLLITFLTNRLKVTSSRRCKHCNTSRRGMLKNKHLLATFHEIILVSLWTFYLILIELQWAVGSIEQAIETNMAFPASKESSFLHAVWSVRLHRKKGGGSHQTIIYLSITAFFICNLYNRLAIFRLSPVLLYTILSVSSTVPPFWRYQESRELIYRIDFGIFLLIQCISDLKAV